MNKTPFILFALLLPLAAPSIHSQTAGQASSLSKSSTAGRARPRNLPDAPFPQGTFVLLPNPDAGRITAPHTALSGEHEYDLAELIDIARERKSRDTGGMGESS